MAKLVLFLVLISILIKFCLCSIWIKGIKSYGPSASIAGSQCLATLTQYYFYNPTVMRAKNIIISHTQNLSYPAAEIEAEFLAWMHHTIANEDILEQ